MARNNTRKHIYISQKSIFKICAVHVIYTVHTPNEFVIVIIVVPIFCFQ